MPWWGAVVGALWCGACSSGRALRGRCWLCHASEERVAPLGACWLGVVGKWSKLCCVELLPSAARVRPKSPLVSQL